MIEVTPLAGERTLEARCFDDHKVQVGRHPDNHLVFAARHVSAHHGEMIVTADGVTYRDLHTSNGSFVRRRETLISVDAAHGFEIKLEEGDELFLGDPLLVTGLTVRVVSQNTDGDQLAPGFTLEILSRLDVSDESKLQRLASAFDHHVLLALQQHAARTARTQRLAVILESFAKAALDFCPKATHVSVYLRQGDEAKPSLVHGHARGASGAAPTPLSNTVWSVVRERREAFTFELTDPTFNSAESLKNSAVHAGMCVPLWTGHTLRGLVQVDGRGERRVPFETRDLEALAVFACQLSTSVANVHLQNELEDTVSQLTRAQHEMQKLAFQDPITGLANRRLFEDRLAHAVQLARRQRRTVALLYVDLDGFKRVNDSFGHNAGDALLRVTAERLRACLRDQDTVARVGGDEFAAILCDVADENAPRLVARKMLDALRAPVSLLNATVTVTACIGIALSLDDESDMSEFIRKADLAMYRARREGQDTFQFFTEDLNLETARRSILEADLRTALTHGDLVQYFRPFVNLAESKISAVEALVRWDHPVHGSTNPGDLRHLADDLGLGGTLAEWALNAACGSETGFKDARLEHVRTSVSISARQFAAPEFARTLQTILGATRIDPARLEVGISERALTGRPDRRLERLRLLRDLGVSICIEDFGTGNFSVHQLKQLPVDALALDPALVQGITVDEADARATAGLIALGHKLGLRAVAKGVGSWPQLEFLEANGCDLAQGPVFDRPRPQR